MTNSPQNTKETPMSAAPANPQQQTRGKPMPADDGRPGE
jgi:hypothetical protein